MKLSVVWNKVNGRLAHSLYNVLIHASMTRTSYKLWLNCYLILSEILLIMVFRKGKLGSRMIERKRGFSRSET